MFRHLTKKDVYEISGLVIALLLVIATLLNQDRIAEWFLAPKTNVTIVSSPTPMDPFIFSVLVVDNGGKPIIGASVIIENLPGSGTLSDLTGNDGYGKFQISRSYIGKMVRLTIQANGYSPKRISQTIDIGNPSVIVQLDK